ncbi:hypothetical protein F7725_017798 [Dissostichus mawsoni]|uniref:Thyroglobulin type-1 domain-containing protein n=1 Tax=Dissostichus mawsoni TaxID=36200 RepID=A0A7J5XQ66_DISMA|nr:hypothetical protein F7725_017798 [Dissostichus mawsoni]
MSCCVHTWSSGVLVPLRHTEEEDEEEEEEEEEYEGADSAGVQVYKEAVLLLCLHGNMARLLSITCILISCCCLIESRASGEVKASPALDPSPPPSLPPQCAADGSFLPVQCKLINTSDSTELDLLLTFNRFPEAFDTFTSFRKVFPTVSSYCFCADSRGREQENTGPSPCETELRAAMAASSVYLPSCEGEELSPPGSVGGAVLVLRPRGEGGPPPSDCLSQRRLVFSRLISGPAPPPSMRPPPPPCLPLPPLPTGGEDPSSLLSLMGEVLQGVFPSVGEALSALSLSSPPRLQETLFGGRFLQNISGGVGVGGVVVGEGLSPDSGGRVQTVIRALKDPNFLSNLQEVQRERPRSLRPLKRCYFAGRCSRALDDVTVFRQEVQSIINLSNSSHLPLGYGFLLAHGLQLTPEELQTGQSEKELLLFSPQCDSDGDWLHTQCHHSTGQCWCVDEDGEYIADSLTSRSLHLPKCLTRCQRAQAHSLLSGWMKGSSTSAYQPTCEEDGGFSVLQKGGADGWCVNPRTGETLQTATQSAAGQLTCPSWCELQGSQCRPDGSFIPLQCDVTSCWCVSEDGQEVGGTRTSRQTGRTPSCDRPLCPNSITHGALCAARQLRVGRAVTSSVTVVTITHFLSAASCVTARLPVSSVSLCDGSSVHLQCVGDDAMKLTFRWSSALTDLPTSDLPDLHHAGLFLNESRLLEGVQGLLGNIRSMFTSEPKLVSMTTPNYGCSHVVCPAGSLSSEGACLQCPQGTYQDEEGQDFCNKCVTECQRRGLRCSDRGDFLSAQPDFLSGRWRCVSSEGAELQWTNREEPLTDNQCSDLLRFQTVSGSDLIVGAEDAEVLKTMTSDLTSCVQACAAEPTCHHTQGFLGNPEAELFDWLSCSLRVRGGASDLLVVRKKEFSPLRYERVRMRKALSGVFRTQVFRRTSLSDALLFCSDGCSADACCHGFTLNLNTLQGGTLPRRHGEHGEHGSNTRNTGITRGTRE